MSEINQSNLPNRRVALMAGGLSLLALPVVKAFTDDSLTANTTNSEQDAFFRSQFAQGLCGQENASILALAHTLKYAEGKKLALPEKEVRDFYVSSLLHWKSKIDPNQKTSNYSNEIDVVAETSKLLIELGMLRKGGVKSSLPTDAIIDTVKSTAHLIDDVSEKIRSKSLVSQNYRDYYDAASKLYGERPRCEVATELEEKLHKNPEVAKALSPIFQSTIGVGYESRDKIFESSPERKQQNQVNQRLQELVSQSIETSKRIDDVDKKIRQIKELGDDSNSRLAVLEDQGKELKAQAKDLAEQISVLGKAHLKQYTTINGIKAQADQIIESQRESAAQQILDSQILTDMRADQLSEQDARTRENLLNKKYSEQHVWLDLSSKTVQFAAIVSRDPEIQKIADTLSTFTSIGHSLVEANKGYEIFKGIKDSAQGITASDCATLCSGYLGVAIVAASLFSKQKSEGQIIVGQMQEMFQHLSEQISEVHKEVQESRKELHSMHESMHYNFGITHQMLGLLRYETCKQFEVLMGGIKDNLSELRSLSGSVAALYSRVVELSNELVEIKNTIRKESERIIDFVANKEIDQYLHWHLAITEPLERDKIKDCFNQINFEFNRAQAKNDISKDECVSNRFAYQFINELGSFDTDHNVQFFADVARRRFNQSELEAKNTIPATPLKAYRQILNSVRLFQQYREHVVEFVRPLALNSMLDYLIQDVTNRDRLAETYREWVLQAIDNVKVADIGVSRVAAEIQESFYKNYLTKERNYDDVKLQSLCPKRVTVDGAGSELPIISRANDYTDSFKTYDLTLSLQAYLSTKGGVFETGKYPLNFNYKLEWDQSNLQVLPNPNKQEEIIEHVNSAEEATYITYERKFMPNKFNPRFVEFPQPYTVYFSNGIDHINDHLARMRDSKYSKVDKADEVRDRIGQLGGYRIKCTFHNVSARPKLTLEIKGHDENLKLSLSSILPEHHLVSEKIDIQESKANWSDGTLVSIANGQQLPEIGHGVYIEKWREKLALEKKPWPQVTEIKQHWDNAWPENNQINDLTIGGADTFSTTVEQNFNTVRLSAEQRFNIELFNLTVKILSGNSRTLVRTDFSTPGVDRGTDYLFISYEQAVAYATALEELTGAKYILDGMHNAAGLNHVLLQDSPKAKVQDTPPRKYRSGISAINNFVVDKDNLTTSLQHNASILDDLTASVETLAPPKPHHSIIDDLLLNIELQLRSVESYQRIKRESGESR